MKRLALVVVLLVSTLESGMAFGQSKKHKQAKVSFDDFKELVAAVEPHRAQRLIDFATFLEKSKQPNTIILDSRSAFRFERVHLKGARHLAFTDFTQANLAQVVPDFDTTILIYCNNNFEGDEVDFASKVAVPMAAPRSLGTTRSGDRERITSQLAVQAKPKMMALNIPTYVNLYGYGYLNVFELDELLDVKDPRVVFEGTLTKPAPPMPAPPPRRP